MSHLLYSVGCGAADDFGPDFARLNACNEAEAMWDSMTDKSVPCVIAVLKHFGLTVSQVVERMQQQEGERPGMEQRYRQKQPGYQARAFREAAIRLAGERADERYRRNQNQASGSAASQSAGQQQTRHVHGERLA